MEVVLSEIARKANPIGSNGLHVRNTGSYNVCQGVDGRNAFQVGNTCFFKEDFLGNWAFVCVQIYGKESSQRDI